MALIGVNGGLVGVARTSRRGAAVGVWTPNEQVIYQRQNTWIGDASFANVLLLLHMDGSNGSTTFTDSSSNAFAVTSFGNAQISTAQSKFGGASGLFDGNGDYLTTPTSTALDLGNTYTIEFWMRANSFASNGGLIHRGLYTTTTNSWNGLAFSIRQLGSEIRFYFYGISNATEQIINVPISGNFTINTWHHVAMTRSGTTGYVLVDGVLKNTISSLNTPAASSRDLKIGVWDYSTGSTVSEWFNGYIDDLRITKGVARYTANFTPPANPSPDA
jgi:hypothetical protein